MSYSELGRRIGLSAPAVAQRVRQLEEAGVIGGYHARLDLARVGRPVTAFIGLRVTPRAGLPFAVFVQDCADILECHLLTGTDSHFMKVAVASTDRLEALIDRLQPFTESTIGVARSSEIISDESLYPVGPTPPNMAEGVR